MIEEQRECRGTDNMAVSPKYTITFPVYPVDKLGNTIQVIMVLSNDDGVNTPISAGDEGLKILDYGKLSWSWDLDDPFLVPSGLSILVSDPEEFISGWMFDSPPDPSIEERDYQVDVEYKYNGSTIWKGLSTEDGIRYDVGDKTLFMDVLTPFEKINERQLYDKDDNPTDPFGWGSSTWRSFPSLLTDIYGLINPSITVDIDHGFIWRDNGASPPGTITDFSLDELSIQVGSWFNSFGRQDASTVGDFLRQLAFEFGCFTGMSTWGKAFFTQIIDFTKVPTITAVEGIEKNWVKGFGYSKIKYINLVTFNTGTGATGVVDYERGDYDDSGVDSSKIVREKVSSYTDSSAASILRSTVDSLKVIDTTEAQINAWGTRQNADQIFNLIDTMWNTRSLIQMSRRDKFEFEGVDYEFPFAFKFGDVVYQTTKMTKDFGNNITEVEAFVWPIDPLI